MMEPRIQLSLNWGEDCDSICYFYLYLRVYLMINKLNKYQVHNKSLPSFPALKIQGCFGWNFIHFTP